MAVDVHTAAALSMLSKICVLKPVLEGFCFTRELNVSFYFR